jgi:hypothetical protein
MAPNPLFYRARRQRAETRRLGAKANQKANQAVERR